MHTHNIDSFSYLLRDARRFHLGVIDHATTLDPDMVDLSAYVEFHFPGLAALSHAYRIAEPDDSQRLDTQMAEGDRDPQAIRTRTEDIHSDLSLNFDSWFLIPEGRQHEIIAEFCAEAGDDACAPDAIRAALHSIRSNFPAKI